LIEQAAPRLLPGDAHCLVISRQGFGIPRQVEESPP
jgi:hypothetical protein